MEDKKVVDLAVMMLVLAFTIAFIAGFMLGHFVTEKDYLNLLEWFKITQDCNKCANWNCPTGFSMNDLLTQNGS
jgi:hypothetical protein